jgi:hypothetical protein
VVQQGLKQVLLKQVQKLELHLKQKLRQHQKQLQNNMILYK